MRIDTSGIAKGLIIIQSFKTLMWNQVHESSWTPSPWPNWHWGWENAQASHYASPWADARYDDIPF